MSGAAECICPYCRDELEFELDQFLLDEVAARNVVIFAGAGVSTENRLSAPHSLYTELAVELDLQDCQLAFPDLAQAYVERPDGRFKLIKTIQERFDYIKKFSDLQHQATKFFQEISTMPYLTTFITTNWDRNFEEICHAKPFAYDTDMRFWEIPNRRVLKIHGTIDDYSSIVVTRDDYNDCEAKLKESLIGAKLKDILSNKTCIFVGYSMRDEDFKEIFSFVRSAQGKFEKTHYFVTPHAADEGLGGSLVSIKTDGTYFFEVIKDHMCQSHCYIKDEIYDFILDEFHDVHNEHSQLWERFDGQEHPQILLSSSYQDGLIHGYQLVLDLRGTGLFSDVHLLQQKIFAYDEKIKGYRSKKSYLNVAYFTGYQNSLLAMVASKMSDDFVPPPKYYHEGIGVMDKNEFDDEFNSLPDVHKSAFRHCKRVVSNWPTGERFVLQHQPWG